MYYIYIISFTNLSFIHKQIFSFKSYWEQSNAIQGSLGVELAEKIVATDLEYWRILRLCIASLWSTGNTYTNRVYIESIGLPLVFLAIHSFIHSFNICCSSSTHKNLLQALRGTQGWKSLDPSHNLIAETGRSTSNDDAVYSVMKVRYK